MRIQYVIECRLSGNSFWFNASEWGHDEDQNLHGKFISEGKEYSFFLEIGYTQDGSSFEKFTVWDSEGVEVYYDKSGKTHCYDGEDVFCNKTKKMIKILEKYV